MYISLDKLQNWNGFELKTWSSEDGTVWNPRHWNACYMRLQVLQDQHYSNKRHFDSAYIKNCSLYLFLFQFPFFCYVCALPCQTILCAYAQTAIHVFCNCFFFFFGKQLTVILKKMSFEGEWRALISILYDPLGNPLIFLEMKHSWFHSHTQTAITAIALELQKGIWKLSVAWMIMPSSFNCV